MDLEITIVLSILGITILLLVWDVIRMDVIAMLSMLALGWTGILEPLESLSGFSSNAVIAMMAVMVMGRGMEKTGIMDRFSRAIIKITGSSSLKITGLVSAAVGLMSSVIQNVGAAALFLPAVISISRKERLPVSKIIMPIWAPAFTMRHRRPWFPNVYLIKIRRQNMAVVFTTYILT